MMSLLTLEDTYQTIQERKSDMPEHYTVAKVEEVGTAPSINPQEVFTENRRYAPTPIWRMQVDTKTFYTPKPISVRIYREEDIFFAENDALVVCGTGATPQEAVQDLNLHVIHFFEYYRNIDNNRLTGDALRLKQLYSKLLIEE